MLVLEKQHTNINKIQKLHNMLLNTEVPTALRSVPFFFFIGSWISGDVGIGDVSIGSDSSVDTSTTVSVITSGLIAAWINSGVDTQGGTKTSTKKAKGKKTKFFVHVGYCLLNIF